MTVNAVTDTKKGRTGIAPTYLHTTQCLVKNRRTRVFTTFEQGQPTKFIKQTSDRSCIEITFFDQTGSTTLNSFRVAGYLWPYEGPTLQWHTPSGYELRTDT